MCRQWPLASLTEGRLDFDGKTFNDLGDCPRKPDVDIRVDFAEGAGRW
jgi:hypothetical protein